MDDAAGTEFLAELGEILLRRVVGHLGLLFSIQVVEVAEEFIEPVNGGQVLVEVAQMVLAELACRVAKRLKQFGDRRILGLEPNRRAGNADFGKAGAIAALASDE